jgi:predicted  nucleic acid-binding Zn ribbon protein
VGQAIVSGAPPPLPEAAYLAVVALYLFTTFLSDLPPVRSGRDGTSIPNYLLPPRDFSKDHPRALKDELYGWASQYGTFDETWIASGELEIAAYRQLADPTSKFVREGRGWPPRWKRPQGCPLTTSS